MTTIPCRVYKGQFSFEYFVEVDLPEGLKQLFVDKSKVYNLGKELSDPEESVNGELEVMVVKDGAEVVLIELPADTFSGGQRFVVRKDLLK